MAGVGRPKGTPKTGGRQPGSPNKTTRAFRETISKLLEDNADNVSLWLAQIAAEDPSKALDMIAKLAEYASPKMSRVEEKSEVTVTNREFVIRRAGTERIANG